jgi:hypothetical protein
LNLITQDNDIICKVLQTTFHGYARVRYYSLKFGSIFSFYDLYLKHITHFSINIPSKKSITKLFIVTQWEDESTRSLMRKCWTWKIYSNLLSLKPLLVDFIAIFYRNDYILSSVELFSKWNRHQKIVFN